MGRKTRWFRLPRKGRGNRMGRAVLRAVFLVGGFLLAGCSLLEPVRDLPTYVFPKSISAPAPLAVLPSPTVVGTWQMLETVSASVPQDDWYAVLGLKGLAPLEEEALKGNPNLSAVAARRTQAEALARMGNATLLPTLGLNAGLTRERMAPGQQGRAQGVDVKTTNTYTVGGAASWELDLFGRLSEQAKAQELGALGAAQTEAAARLALQAQVARAYVTLLAATHVQQAWQNSALAAEGRHVRLKARFDAGEVGMADWQAAEATYEATKAAALNAAVAARQMHHALAILVGRTPQVMPLPHDDLLALYASAPQVPQGPVDSSALLGRPDVQAAASGFKASLANIGAARAAFFPRLTLAATGGFSSPELADLFTWNNHTWSAGPALVLPPFNFTTLRANLARNWGAYEEAVAAYRGQLLGAFRDVADGLVAVAGTRAAAADAKAAWEASVKAQESLQKRYDLGDVARTDVLAAQMAADQGRMAFTQQAAAAYLADINLMAALGGRP